MELINKDGCMEIAMVAGAAASWYYILQKGFALDGVAGTSVRRFLHDALGFDDGFIDSTVRTIFLNNSPLDDLDRTYIKDGDRLALGSAMPGLVGIVMGRDNLYKSFRSEIEVKDHSRAKAAPARVGMKIFSTLAVETGRGLLARGILVDAGLLADFLRDKEPEILEVNGEDADGFLKRLGSATGYVFIRVTFV